MERHHLAVAPSVDEPLHQAPVEAAHEVGVGLGQLAERTAGERDGGAVVVDDRLRIEAEGGELLGERLGTGAGRRPAAAAVPCSRPASTASAAGRSALAARRRSIRASTGNAGGSKPSDGASAASE